MPRDLVRLACCAAVLAAALGSARAQAPPPSIPTDQAHVVHANAPLRDAPDLAAAPSGTLRAHEVVTILDRRRAPEGWLKVRQAFGDRTTRDGWARLDDLAMGLEQSPGR